MPRRVQAQALTVLHFPTPASERHHIRQGRLSPTSRAPCPAPRSRRSNRMRTASTGGSSAPRVNPPVACRWRCSRMHDSASHDATAHALDRTRKRPEREPSGRDVTLQRGDGELLVVDDRPHDVTSAIRPTGRSCARTGRCRTRFCVIRAMHWSAVQSVRPGCPDGTGHNLLDERLSRRTAQKDHLRA